MQRTLQLYKIPLAIGSTLLLLYGSFAYDVERHDFIKLFTLCFGLFGLTYVLIKYVGGQLRFALGMGIVFRLIFLVAIPNLSQDFYRFIWDGFVVLEGSNPYLFTPEQYLLDPEIFAFSIPFANELYDGMGALNGSHFTNYPALKQLFFALSVFLGGKTIVGSVIAMHVLLLFADIWIFQIGRKLLKEMGQSDSSILWYFLNPFIIIELNGNLHFEALMLAFLLYSIYLLKKGRFFYSGIFMAFSIALKLIPLLFIPLLLLFFVKNGKPFWFKGLRYFLGLTLTLMLTLLPFVTLETILPFLKTTALWFQNFEFNASIYYIIREIGYEVVGWNIIETAGKVLALCIFVFVMVLALFRKNQQLPTLLESMLLSIGGFYLLSTTIHPWYIALPVLLGVISQFRFPIIWSFLVFLSYSAYSELSVNENLWLIATEYLLLIGFAFWELKQRFIKHQTPPGYL